MKSKKKLAAILAINDHASRTSWALLVSHSQRNQVRLTKQDLPPLIGDIRKALFGNKDLDLMNNVSTKQLLDAFNANYFYGVQWTLDQQNSFFTCCQE
jgi:hypothetical protein